MIDRLITAEIRDSPKSALILGPRQAGKSTLIRSLKPDLEIDLADELEFLKYSSRLLRSYAANYLKEEIKAEALVRNLESFARFFQAVVSQVAEFVDYTKLAKNSKISRHAIPRYFEILEDTLIGYRVFPYVTQTPDLDLIKHPKFYLFDNGVYNGLLGNFTASPDRLGRLSEQLVFSQILHSSWAKEKNAVLSSFRTRSGIEVDLIAQIEGKIHAIEIKSSDSMGTGDLDGLRYFDQSIAGAKRLFIFHMGKSDKKHGNIWSLPWQKGLREMGL